MQTIGFVGLGQMGGAMSRNLVAAGYALQVFDVQAKAVAALVDVGASGAESPAAASRGADVVFTMLPIGAIVEQACFGPAGIAEGIARGALLVDMSTILPAETVRIGARLAVGGVGMVDAKVGRTSAHAAAGTSTFMVGGALDDIERVRPLLLTMGESITVCGPLGAGATMKLVNNAISAVINLATAEGLALGLAAGLDLAVMTEVLAQTPVGRGHLTTAWPDKALVDDPSPAFMLDLATKDLGLATELAADLQVPLPAATVAWELYQVAQAHGHGREDWTTGVFRTMRELGAG